jgi:hypothetical protein
MASSPADKARAMASSALEFTNKKIDPSCTECTETPSVRAVILYPNLGTPLIIPPSETKLTFFVAAESRSRILFGVTEVKTFPSPAPLGYMYVDKHLRIYPIKDKSVKEDTKAGRLWSDGKLCATAFKHVRVWCVGRFEGGIIRDITGKIVAHIRPKTVEGYGSISPVSRGDKDPMTKNEPLEWIYQIEIELDYLPRKLSQGSISTLAWMIAVPDSYKTQKDLFGIIDWEYQDKLIYDFLEDQKKKANKNHVPDLYEFDVSTATSKKLPLLKKDIPKRLKSWHPIMIGNSNALKLGHLSDVHINCRQFSLAASSVKVLEGVSGKVGGKVNNCFVSLRELFREMKAAGADAIFLTGDLLDFNRNLDPRKMVGENPKDQWPGYDLNEKLSDNALYPRGIDDMLVFSLLRYSYAELGLPVYLTTGNHEAYDVPYGISPRANPFIIKRIHQQVATDPGVVIPARLRVAVQTASTASKRIKSASDGAKAIPFIGAEWDRATKAIEGWGRKAIKDLGVNFDPNSYKLLDAKMNEGIPADHNLTIYEACLIYGPSFPQVVRPFNFIQENFDWFFMLFTPLANYQIDYENQVLVGLDWGESEIMVNLDISGGELKETEMSSAGIAGALSGLPRADKSLNGVQKEIIEQARGSKKKVMLFSHFTIINYDLPFSLSHESKPFEASDNVFNNFTKGTFSQGRDWLYPRLNNGIHYTLSGHSHRSGLYRLKTDAQSLMSAVGYQPPDHRKLDDHSAKMHARLFSDPHASRIAVSSCGGPIGVQNYRGELYGWNLMPPSGTLIDVNAPGVNEIQRVAPVRYLPAKPRFCVALDYVQCHMKKQVIAWIPTDKPGWYQIVAGNVLDAKPFMQSMCLHMWEPLTKEFIKFELNINPVAGHPCLYNCYILQYKKFFDKTTTKWGANGDEKHIFAQINFNETLAEVPIYSHYNFSDPWIFRVDVEKNDGTQPFIVPARGTRSEIPDWAWLATVNPAQYPSLPTKHDE